MGKKYLDTKEGTLESSILGVWRDAVGVQEEDNPSSRVDARTKSYREHRAKLEAARLRREKKKLVGGQKKLDKDKDGDIDAKDFAILRKQAKKEEVDLDEKREWTKVTPEVIEEAFILLDEQFVVHGEGTFTEEQCEIIDILQEMTEEELDALDELTNPDANTTVH